MTYHVKQDYEWDNEQIASDALQLAIDLADYLWENNCADYMPSHCILARLAAMHYGDTIRFDDITVTAI